MHRLTFFYSALVFFTLIITLFFYIYNRSIIIHRTSEQAKIRAKFLCISKKKSLIAEKTVFTTSVKTQHNIYVKFDFLNSHCFWTKYILFITSLHSSNFLILSQPLLEYLC
jgi:hypothetical protein